MPWVEVFRAVVTKPDNNRVVPDFQVVDRIENLTGTEIDLRKNVRMVGCKG